MLNIAHARANLLRLSLVTSQIFSPLVLASGAASLATAISPTASVSAASSAAPNAGLITGLVFNDFNANGSLESNEPGVVNVTVTAVDASGGAPTSTTTDASGLYTLTVAGASARLEFTGLPAQFQSSPAGVGAVPTNSNTSVRFVAAPSANVNFGIFRPSAYCQNNPSIAITCFVSGDNVSGPWRDDGTVKTHPYNATGVDASLIVTHALAKQTGSTYGLAWQRSSQTIFVSAYTKRIAGYGPGTGTANSDGTGTIYTLKPGGTGAVPFIDLDDVFGPATTGVNPHTSLDPVANDFDKGAYAAVGKVALGDIDISEDETTLWVVNLANRTLYGLPIGLTPTAPTAGQITSTPVPDPGCANGVGRPFGVKPYNGLIYVGGVCTAEQLAPTTGITTDLQAYVYAFDPGTSTWSGPVLQFPLNYPRTCVDLFPSYPSACKPGVNGSLALWRPWRDELDLSFPAGWDTGYTAYPQPMLTDIEFLDNGDMVVAFRDRFADQLGYDDPGPDNNSPRGYNLFALPAGDILRAGLNANANIAGSWTIESNSASNPPGRFGPTTGQNTGEGPGNGEFYHGDVMPSDHDETALGSLAYAPVFSAVVATVFDPLRLLTAGTGQFSNTTGDTTREFEVYPPLPPNTGSSFRKANGLGDLELLCDAAPLEIGNRIWLDSNGNGVQDPDEPILAGVQITLTDSLGNSATATTDSNGEYRFSSAAGTNTGNAIYNLNGAGTVLLNPFNAFTLTVDLAQAALSGLTPTLPTADGTFNGTARDSNGVLSIAALRSASVATLTTGGPGFNNHTYDFGFVLPSVPTPTPTNTPTSTPTNTPTATPTNTPTSTPTNTPTATPTDTPTSTPTNTPTNTPVLPTATPTNTPTNTPVLPTATPTNTPTNTPVLPTATPTNTPTNTPVLPTATPTNTPTNTPVLPTATPTNTPTNTPVLPTATPTNTPTSTPVPPTPTNTPTITPTNVALVIVKSSLPVNGAQVTNGDRITYTLTVTNISSATATNVIIEDALPLGTTYITGSAVPSLLSGPDPLVWNVGSLVAGQSTQVAFAVTVNQFITVTAIENQSFVRSDQTPRQPSNRIIHPFVPTAVTLLGFDVQTKGNGQGLRIRWQTGSEVNTFGFALYRSEQASGADSVLVTSEMVRAQGTGATYVADDATANLNQRYYYWLVEAEQNGQLIRYAPAEWRPGAASPSPIDTEKTVEQGYVVASSALGGGIPVPVQVIQPNQVQVGVSPPQQTLGALGSNAQDVVSVVAGRIQLSDAPAPAAPQAEFSAPSAPGAGDAAAQTSAQAMGAEVPQAMPTYLEPAQESGAQNTAPQGPQSPAVVAERVAERVGEKVEAAVQPNVAEAAPAPAQVVDAGAVYANPHQPAAASPTQPAGPMGSINALLGGLALVVGLLFAAALGMFGLSLYRAHRRG